MNTRRTAKHWERWARERGAYSLYTFLYGEYVEKRLTLEKVGTIMDVSPERVAQLLRKHGIPVRPRGGVFV